MNLRVNNENRHINICLDKIAKQRKQMPGKSAGENSIFLLELKNYHVF